MTLRSRAMTAALLLAMFALLLAAGGAGSAADEAAYLFLYGHPALVPPARLFTELGGWKVLIPLSLLGAAILLARRRRADALLLLAVTLGGRLLVSLLKEIVARPRPALEEHIVAAGSASFPSGHAANGLIVWLAIALLLPARTRSWSITAAVLLAVVIGLSRVILGVHWPSDVLGGWSFALLWTFGLILLVDKRSRSRHEARNAPASASFFSAEEKSHERE